jgi:uncharacterized protein YidB (DUF937 family)
MLNSTVGINMGLFDSLASAALGQLGGTSGIMSLVSSNPQLMQVAGSLLSGEGNLQGILDKFTQNGHGTAVQSWVGTGENHAITGDHVTAALGGDMISGLAAKAGVSGGDMSGILAQMLPMLVDKMTPNGQMASNTGSDQIMSMLGGLLKG